MKKAALFFTVLMLAGISNSLFAQPAGTRIPPRKDDHFQRNKVVSRVDLENKMNTPLINATSPDLYVETGFENNQGIIATLVAGLKAGKFLGYDPENLEKSLTYDDLVSRSQEFNGNEDCADCDWELPSDEDELLDLEGDLDPDLNLDSNEDPFFEEGGTATGSEDIQIAPLESVMEIIEDRIMDKNRSDMVYDLQYIRLVWVDPAETMPDKNFVCLKYEDVMDVLDDARWANKFNDAEDRSLREILELRLFESYAINIRGRGVKSIEESAFRTQQMVEFEHHLWSY